MTESTSRDIRVCRACKKEIEPEASVCHLCQRDQSKVVSNFNRTSGFVAAMGLLATIAGTLLSVHSAIEAKEERIRAEQALEKAVEAEKNTIELSNSVQLLNDDMSKTIMAVFVDQRDSVIEQYEEYEIACSEELPLDHYACLFQVSHILGSISSSLQRQQEHSALIAKSLGVDVANTKHDLCKNIDSIAATSERIRLGVGDMLVDTLARKFEKIITLCRL